ncbi:MAG: tetratricopeptide repeat protein [Nannocystales bacterium]
MSERDERWQALQDALALEEPVDADPELGPGPSPGPNGSEESHWREELDFYASLAEHAMREAPPTSNDEALIEAALLEVPAAPAATSGPRIGLVAAVVALAAVGLLWVGWPAWTPLRSSERSWTSEAQDVLGELRRQLETAETLDSRSDPKPPEVEASPEPEPEPEPEPALEVEAEAAPTPAKRSRPRPGPDAATLVATARAARGKGQLAEAERSYGELLRRFPKSAEARAGRVALAQIKLGRGKTKAALRLFTAAAGGGGPLAEEAAWGRIQALDRLGRKDGLRKAVEAFVQDYPTSVYRARAQGRLEP